MPEEAPTLEEVVVTGQSGGEGPAYAAQESRTATKTRTLLLETPQAVSVVTRKLIEDEGVQDLEGALRNVAGVSVGGYYNEWDYYRIRGFDASYTNTYLDGLLADGAPFEELWAFERIEVIKGPASTLFGQGPLGGFVNLVSKRPRPDFFGEVQFTAGSFDYYQGAFDVNVPAQQESDDLRSSQCPVSLGGFVRRFCGIQASLCCPGVYLGDRPCDLVDHSDKLSRRLDELCLSVASARDGVTQSQRRNSH